ncbi:hypothetical protein [Kribbella sp. VKM Ac-2568]|uniref:hypothetical protein n=1 Tax=Kribbella sp. VKM Ac-2568 TaxID=2512219 RepID=UPI00130525E6|nr:hypothetical protein [Kribbella sp. VKM Ac-2568]
MTRENKELWVWTGVNCLPVDQVDPELLRPYSAFLHAKRSAIEPAPAVPRPAA